MAVNSRQLSLFEHRALPNSSSSNKNTCRFGWCQIPPLSETPSKNGYISYISYISYIYIHIYRHLFLDFKCIPIIQVIAIISPWCVPWWKAGLQYPMIRGWSGDPWPTISHYKDSHCWMHDHKPIFFRYTIFWPCHICRWYPHKSL